MLAAAADAVRVRVADPPAVTLVGVNDPVTPAGKPDTDSDTVCAVPLTRVVDTVTAADVPAITLTLGGLTASEKTLGGNAVTDSVPLAVWLPDVAVPVTE